MKEGDMKKIVLAALTGVILVSCTIERTVIQEATTTAPATTQPEITAAPERQNPTLPPTTPAPVGGDETSYLRELHNMSPITRDIDDYTLTTTGWAVCDGIASGATLNDLADMILASATDESGQDMLTWVTVLAVTHLCPQYSYVMDNGY